MASVNCVPANERISVKNSVVTLTNAPITMNNIQRNQDKLPKDCEYVESIKGRFSWTFIAGHHVPYIIRVINGEQLKFVSLRMAESKLLSNYLHYLHADIYTCTSIRRHFITAFEAKLLRNINEKHADSIYGSEGFFAGKDYIVRLEDAHEFYTFIKVCYEKLQCNITPGSSEKCGFIRINSESVVPYCIKDNLKYVPLFYFEGKTENLRHLAVKLENWNLAYLKFCCKVMLIRNEYYVSDSYTAISLDDIKNCYPPETSFEEFWPAKLDDTHLLINQKSTHGNPPGAWTRGPAEVVPRSNTIAHTLTAPALLQPSMPVIMNTYQNGRPADQMVNSYSTQAQPPSTRGYSIAARNQSIPAQCSNADSTMFQGSSLVNSSGHVVPTPLLVRAGNTTPVIGNTASYSSVVPISQCITTMYNPVTNGNVMSHLSPTGLFYTQFGNSILAQEQQQIQQQQQIITTPQTQQPYSDQSVHDRLTNTQPCNVLRNAGPVAIAPPLEIIDSSSPPSSPVPPAMQENPLRPNISWEFTRIPKRTLVLDTPNNAAYMEQQQIQRQQQIITTPQTQQPYSDQSVHDRLTNTQPCNVLRNAGPDAIAPPLEIIDSSSPPSSPVPPAMQENPLRPNITWEFTRIPERTLVLDTPNNAAYKIQEVKLQGRIIQCINAEPYIYSDLMVALHDFVQMLLPSCTLAKCASDLNKKLKTTLFSGNSEQLAVLRENGRARSKYPDETPLVRLQDIEHALPQLKALVFKHDEEIQQYQAAAAAAGGPTKRQRTS